MKRRNIAGAGLLTVALLAGSFTGYAAEQNKSLDVMFVHDTHSHLNEFATVEDGESQILGGFSKIKTLSEDELISFAGKKAGESIYNYCRQGGW